jgi:N-acetylglucosaminyldiphosphoundecaprenol N-acetyl-beta-D-mannosaminyltransferase
LVGTTDEHIATAAEKLRDKLNIVYYRNGFFSNNTEINNFFDELEERKVDTIILGMGAPYQERMLHFLKERKFPGLAFTCGGYLEQLARKDVVYYPDFFNRYNLRWLYRILDEPGKLIRRYVIDYSFFYIEYVKFLLISQLNLNNVEKIIPQNI